MRFSVWVLAILLTALALMTSLGTAQSGRGDRVSGAPFAGRSPVIAQKGVAATSHPLASQVALDILKAGGNAVDAAIAANILLGLVEPTGCGIGGDLFAIVWDPSSRRLLGLNSSGPSPRGLSLERLRQELGDRDEIPGFGPLPVSVPGAVDGWYELHNRLGKLPWKDLFSPAITYARQGFPVTQVIAQALASNLSAFQANQALIPAFENFERTYLRGGRMPREGEVFQNPDLAATLEEIATGGRDAFYKGRISDVIDRYARRTGLFLRRSDLADFQSEWVDPVSVSYRGFEVFELPPNGQGIAALQMLNILEGFDLRGMGPGSADVLHLMIEAKKIAFEDRARFYADPRFAEIPIDRLLSKDYARQRREKIRLDQAAKQIAPVPDELAQGDTVYLATADRDGMMVSLIQSNYLGMGSGMVPDGLGFVLQNRGVLFALDTQHANAYAPGKRPFHTIIPGFVLKDGEPFLSFGVMGGDMQPQGHVQVLSQIIDFGMNVQEAGDAARFYHGGSSSPTGFLMRDGGYVSLESGVGAAARAELARRGHRIVDLPGAYGGYQAILWDRIQKAYHAASEMRKDGQAVGY